MGKLVLKRHLSTQHGLVAFQDYETEDNPVAETGNEVTISLPGKIFVATQNDSAGDVEARVYVGEPNMPNGRLVLEHAMVFRSSFLSITRIGDFEEEDLFMPRTGKWNVRVFVEGKPHPHTVALCLDEAEWLAAGGEIKTVSVE
ncbi:hypothetical protein GCM10010331_48160 [Streptomyces xanthochromogenes]|uniref:hypothetical protein n=1 Tax=Streptomyces xanthochromogenes TaxID=67384 RepID=UPI00167AF07B|nr:hypothetical protein [Streptomyces xanthochromogenes]GHB54810.1 hypothetical protein GCM10010331_48160 [Streptomyces xanthochromogenes]